MSATITEVIARVRDMLDEQVEGQWLNPQLRRWLNEGLDDVARETRQLKDIATFNTVANQGEYTLAANILDVEFADFITTDGRYVSLEPVHYEGADQMWGPWQNQSSYQPGFFTLWGYPPVMKMKLFPVPSAINAISMHVSRMATKIDITGAGDSSNIDFPEVWIDVLVDYCEYRALRKDKDSQRSQEAYTMYREKRDSMKMEDHMDVSRNVIYAPGSASGLPAWLVNPGGRW